MMLVLASCEDGIEQGTVLTSLDYPKYDAILNGYEGIAVFPEEDIYKMHFEGKGDLDAFILTTCHRESTKEKAWNVKSTIRYGLFGWGKRVIDNKREIEFDYKPTYIESGGDCIMLLQGFEVAGKNSYFAADFENKKYQLGAYEQCSGITKKVNGTSMCQAKIGNYQGISFDEVVQVSDKNKCGIIGGKKNIEYVPNGGFCTVIFKGVDTGKKHKLTIYGYNLTQIRR